MLFTEEWLRSLVNPQLSTQGIGDALTMHGLEVEAITTAAPAFSGVVVAKVVSCRDHENSDHLHVCEVDAGTGELLQIVCGAPNVRAGIKVACAMIGAKLPGGFEIKKTKLRGEVSMGMLCSTRELGINNEHGGIWILDDEAPIGQDIRSYADLDAATIELKVTPNRGDALSVLGIARDLHAVTGAPLNLPVINVHQPSCSCELPIEIDAAAHDLCGRFSGRILRGLNAKAQTPEWMKRRLERSGQRSISPLVDISNYVMLELGVPNHIYDLRQVKEGLTVRWARDGEKVELLNDQTVELKSNFGVIVARDGVAGIAGIMGAKGFSVVDDTTDVFIEAAFWHPSAIQGRCRALNFSTDSAYRYERGVDFEAMPKAVEYLTQLILQIMGTAQTHVGVLSDKVVSLPTRPRVRMRVARCRKIVGVDIPLQSMKDAFTRLGFEYQYDAQAEVFDVVAPSARFDIEIEEDLIEEVARLYGYENLPDRPPLARTAMKMERETTRSPHALRCTMAMLGYQELINFSFVPPAWETMFAESSQPIRLLNPIASQLSVMRTQLIGGLVDILKYNLNRRAERVRLFELGRVFKRNEAVESGPWTVKGIEQPRHVAGLAYGPALDAQWGVRARHVDFYDVKGDLERLLSPLKPTFEKAVFPGLHPGRSAAVKLDGQVIGFLGELHPATQQALELPHAPIVFEVAVDPLLVRPLPQYRPISKFQPAKRDLSVVVPVNYEVSQLMSALERAQTTHPALASITSFNLFDLYRPQAQDGKTPAEKSLAFSVELTSFGEEALSEESIEETMKVLLSVLEQAGAKLRA